MSDETITVKAPNVVALDLQDYVGAATSSDFLTACFQTAKDLVTGVLTASPLHTKEVGMDEYQVVIPTSIVDQAILEVGAELFHRKNAPNGVAQFTTVDSTPIRVARDPMVAARPMLAPYLSGGFA